MTVLMHAENSMSSLYIQHFSTDLSNVNVLICIYLIEKIHVMAHFSKCFQDYMQEFSRKKVVLLDNKLFTTLDRTANEQKYEIATCKSIQSRRAEIGTRYCDLNNYKQCAHYVHTVVGNNPFKTRCQ